jgi:hypothetical protein
LLGKQKDDVSWLLISFKDIENFFLKRKLAKGNFVVELLKHDGINDIRLAAWAISSLFNILA